MISVAKANLDEEIKHRQPHEMPTRSEATDDFLVFSTEDEVVKKTV